MKNTPLFRRLLSVALVVALLGTLLVPTASAAPDKAAEPSVEELTLTPIDPGELESQKLGQTEPEDAIEQEDHALNDVVRVSIALDKASTLDAGFSPMGIADNAAAKIYRAGLRAYQAAVTARIEQATGSKLDVKWNLTLAANIISANVLYGQIDAIKGVKGVKDVFLENRYEPQVAEQVDEPNNGSASYMIGSNITWAEGYTGAGSKVAVIDTGIDKDHLSFDAEALEYAFAQNAEEKGLSYEDYIASLDLLNAEKIDALKDQLNANISSGSQAYINTKIGFGYNYIDGNLDIIHLNDTQGEHGSHVEGIAAGNRFVKVDGEFVPALSAVGTQGVAPDAQIVTMKVFGSGGGAYDSDYMSAIEDAIVLGCDSANLSLGSGSAGFSFSNGYEEILNKLVKNGTVVAFSAGNSGGWLDVPYDSSMYPYLYADDVNYATGGSPGSFTNSLATASVDNMGQTGMPLIYGDRHVFYSQTSGYGNEPIATIAGNEYEYVLLDSPGVDDNAHVGAEGDDFFALGSEVLSGKVAMCYRGSSSFFAKANAAVAQGAVAVVIINNVDGIINMNLTDYAYHAPAVSILKADGDAIKAASEAVTDEEGNVLYYTGTMSVGAEIEVQVPELTDTVTVSSFSSYGVPASMVLKPEILTPGGSIYSVWGANKGQSSPTDSHTDYEVMSGTSMASPQTAGMAAVLGQYIRDNNLCEKTGLSPRQLINSLLMSTAHPVFDENGDYWPVFRVGAGLGNVGDAVAAKSYILMDEDATLFPDSASDGKVKVELGDDPDWTGEFDFGFTVYPLEGQKEFTLRTDIFTQWLAGNGGYGMLQDTATVLLGSEATYEINGETYEDSYLIEADVNMDGVTDAADAQAILDHITGAAAEEDPFDAEVADVDGDGKISSYDAKLLLDSAETPIVEIGAPTHVQAHVKLSEDDIAFLANYFTNGFYIEGYTYIDPVADEEGAMDVTHSIPIFGFCGNWTDPSMLDRSSPIDVAYGTAKRAYLSNPNTNYLSLKDPDGVTAIYMGNPYIVEDEFPADRLAMNSEATIQAFSYLNIRNAATLGFALRDEEGKVLYSQATPTQMFAAYYYVNGGAWQNYNPRNYTVAKKLSAMGAKEGDKVNVGFFALPEYYAILNAKLNGEVAASGGLDNDGFKAILETGLVGKGAGVNYTVTIDDTAPVVAGAFRDLITGDITVKASDNNFIAYVGVLNKSGTKEYFGTVPAQSEAGAELEIPLELEGIKLPNEVTLLVADYAGNEAAFKVSLGGGEEENNGGLMIGFTSANGSVGAGNRALQITPEELFYQSATSFGGVAVYSNTNFKVDAAEYVDGYVFMAANDGWFYAAPLDALDESEAVGKYSNVTAKIYDMAFNYDNNKLYALGESNIIYEVNLLTGKLTPVVVLTLNGVTGVYAVANTLAIDDDGNFYVANYGATSSAKLFKFTLPEVEEPEPEPEEDKTLIAGFYFDSAESPEDGFSFVDADGDGNNWAVVTTASPEGQSGDGKLMSFSYDYSTGAIAPDNWAISPAVDLSGRTEPKVSFWAQNWSSSWLETIAFYVGATPNPDEMIKLGADVQPMSGAWQNYSFAIPEELADADAVYAAVRHYNSEDQYRIYVDSIEFRGEPIDDGEPEIPEEPVIEPEPLTVEPVSSSTIGCWNYNNGGAMAWDHNEDVLYLAGNYNTTTDTDHNLWIVNTTTGKGTKVGATGQPNPGRFYVCLTGLFIVPGEEALIKPTDEPTDLIVEPETLNLLKGQSSDLRISVMPWTLTDKSFTIESADPAIASVNDKGVVTGVEVGETVIKVSTVAEPVITKEVQVTVESAPRAELRGIIWDENGKGQASAFDSNATSDWTAEAQVGAFRWGVLVDDTVYGSTDDTMLVYDADTYEVSSLGGIVADWIPSDAIDIPADMAAAWGLDAGFRVGGLCYNGTYFEVLNPEAGSLNYWNLSSAYASDPMAVITTIGRGDFTVNGTDLEDALHALVITESGRLWDFYFDQEGSLRRVDTGLNIKLSLEGVSDVTNSIWASLHYSEETNFLYLSLYDGADDFAHLYAIDYADPSRMAEVGTFNENVWPVVGLHQYEPATDLVLKVDPTEIEIFETQKAELNIKVKMGETNGYSAKIADPSIISFEDGVITGLKEGETDLIITTVDANDEGEQLSETVHVVVKGLTALNLTVKGQVTDAKGARFTSILLDGPTAGARGPEAPFDVLTGGRFGDNYMAGTASSYEVLDAENFEPVDLNMGFEDYASYPPTDIANYPSFIDEEGELAQNYVLFPVTAGYLVTPDLYGWNLSSYVSDMAGFAFAGLDEADDGSTLYVYYMLTASGVLYEIDINPAAGRITNFQALLETDITVEDPNNLSMAFVYGVDAAYSSTEEAYGLVIANNEDKTMWFIDFQTGEVGMIGTLDADNVSGLIGYFDELATIAEDYEPPVDPFADAETALAFDFEENPTDWTFVDKDGDNYTWAWNFNTSSWFSGSPDFASMAYEGEGCIMSASYINTVGVLYPDNWAVSPAMDLSELGEGTYFSFFAKNVDSSYAAEHFAIYAGNTPNPDEMTQISEEFVLTGDWKRYYADLSDFAGESEVYVAIRHFNCTDMYIMVVDKAEVLTGVDFGDDSGAIVIETPDFTARHFVGEEVAKIGDGIAAMNASASVDGITAVELTKLGEAVNEAVGGTNAAKLGNVTAPKTLVKDETTAEDGLVTVVLTEDEAVTNGLITATYDPEVLTYVDTLSDVQLFSVNEKDGVICFAYAAVEEIPAETALATLRFSYNDGEALDTVVTVKTLERGSDLEVEDEALDIEIKAEPHVHAYGEPVWSWAEDNSSATATFTCEAGDDEQSIEATVTEETTPATCTEEGNTTYTATVEFEGETYTDTKVVAIEALGHTPGEPVTEARVEPTCTEDGHEDEVVYCSVCHAELSRETKTIPALGHMFGEPTAWTWNADHSKATAKVVCSVCGAEELLEAVVTSETIPATDKTEGKIIYTATVEVGGKTYTNTEEVIIPKTAHECPTKFVDIPAFGTVEHDAIDWAYLRGVTKGTDETHFEPNRTVTRGEAVTFLWRAAGKPAPKTTNNPFTDVAEGRFYYRAVLWANEMGITRGTTETTFEPNKVCNRAEILTFLYRWAGSPKVNTKVPVPFTDVSAGRYYYKAMLWALENGIDAGISKTEFGPTKASPRVEIVVFLYRAMTGEGLVN